MTLQLDSSTVIASCAAIGVISAAFGWISRHFIRDVMGKDPGAASPVLAPYLTVAELKAAVALALRDCQSGEPSLTAADLRAALALHEVSMLDRFNGRYPSKEVFEQGMSTVKGDIAEVRKYIGDAKRELSGRIDVLSTKIDSQRRVS